MYNKCPSSATSGSNQLLLTEPATCYSVVVIVVVVVDVVVVVVIIIIQISLSGNIITVAREFGDLPDAVTFRLKI